MYNEESNNVPGESVSDMISNIPLKTVYKIETSHGVYSVKRPVGRIGVKHFSLSTKVAPSRIDENGNPVYSEKDQERVFDAFEAWAEFVLPKIIIDGPYPVNEMPGEDQYSIFIAMVSTVDVGKDLFRFVE